MVRTLLLAFVLALPTMASAEQFPESALHAPVRAHDGTVLGRVSAVERNAEGDIVAVEIPGLEPPDAPGPALVAEREEVRTPARAITVREAPPRRGGGFRRAGA
jgi:hypothetical protein